jgi:hypothetical protein
MSLIYKKIVNKPEIFTRLLGIKQSYFEEIVEVLVPIWSNYLSNSYCRPGRAYKHDLSTMVILLLIYYRSYITQDFLGYLFDLDKSNVCRIIKKLEPLLASVLPIPKRRILSKEEVESLILDVTEQPIERPKKGQKDYYSGKKKYHTLKTELRINQEGTIVQVSKSYPGKTHDFAIFKQEPPPPDQVLLQADRGYQGLNKLYEMAVNPYKSSKKRALSSEQKLYNKELARNRCRIEHVIRDIKVFKIIGNRYRNKRKRYELKFKIVARIVNLKKGSKLARKVA